MDNKITLDPLKIDVVDINQVRANTWNPKDKDTSEFATLVNSIKTNGLRTFIVVRENSIESSKFEIIDGEQKWRACKELGYDKVIIYNEGVVEDKLAKELTLWWQVQVPFNDLSLAKLVTAMMETYKNINIPFDEKKIIEMQELAKFTFGDYKQSTIAPPPAMTELLKTFMVQVTDSQLKIVQQALDKAKKAAEADITDSKALEFVCAEYINSPEGTTN